MPASTRAFVRRGSAVCVAAAILLGGTFTAGAATAAPTQDIEPTSISPAPASAAATPSVANAPSNAALPEGLAEAVERDLGITVEEFNKRGALAAKAAQIQADAGPDAAVSLDSDTITVKTPDPAGAKTAASDPEVNIETVSPGPETATKKIAATSVDALLSDYIAEFKDVSNLQAVMRNAAGDFVIRTGNPAAGGPAMASSTAPAAEISLSNFAAKYGNVTIEAASGPATGLATDVTNGQGYAAYNTDRTGGRLCSIGWNGFNAVGDPAVISAGHCTIDGVLKDSELTVPVQDKVGVFPMPGVRGELLGTLGFSQFGGLNNTTATAPPDWNGDPNAVNNIGTDISVIDVANTELNQLAKVTDWTTPQAPKSSGPLVTDVSTAIVGSNICKSGRTTGWACSTVSGITTFLVAGPNYLADPEDIRAVRGFESLGLKAAEGDSGGSIIAGTLAVGMVSAGGRTPTGDPIVYGVDIKDSLSYTAGYSVKIFLNAPTVTSTAPVYREGAITGTVNSGPAGSTVVVTVDGVTTEVAVGADGTWSAKAPNEFGTFKVTAVAKNGFSESATATGSVEVIKETLPAPAITAPVNEGTVAAPVTAVTGTGMAGATVELTGDVTGTAIVNEAGHWSVSVTPSLATGNYTVTAMQTLTDWNNSPATTSAFVVVPAAPAIVSPANGAEFAFNEGPTEISGSNVAQASVVVTVNGTSYNAVVVNTTWSVALNARPDSGTYSVTAVQSVDGAQSVTATSSFVVLAEPAPAPAPEQTQQAQVPAPRDNGMDLASTGASSTTILLGAAGGLLLLGGAAFLLIRRRNSNEAL